MWCVCYRAGAGRLATGEAPHTHLFMKVTMYMRRGVQIMGWSVRMAFMACFTQ